MLEVLGMEKSVGQGRVSVRKGNGEEGVGVKRTCHFVVHDDACFGYHYPGAEEEVDGCG